MLCSEAQAAFRQDAHSYLQAGTAAPEAASAGAALCASEEVHQHLCCGPSAWLDSKRRNLELSLLPCSGIVCRVARHPFFAST